MVLGESLILEAEFLILEGLFSLGADSELGKFIHDTVVLLLDVLEFGLKRCLFGSIIISKLLQLLIFVLDLVGKALLLIFDRKNSSISLRNLSCDLFKSLVELTSFLVEFLQLEIILFARVILQIVVALFEFGEIPILGFNLLLHDVVLFFQLVENVLHVLLQGIFVFFESVVSILIVVVHFGDPVFIFLDRLSKLLFRSSFVIDSSLFKTGFLLVVEPSEVIELGRRLLVVIFNHLINFSVLGFDECFKLCLSLLESLFSLSHHGSLRLVEILKLSGSSILDFFSLC